MMLRTLHLSKGEHRWLFRYAPGREEEVIDAIVGLVEDPDSDVDWLDAATLGFQVAENAAQACRVSLAPADVGELPFLPDGDGFGAGLNDAMDGPCESFG